jgi:hypothetical protein
MKKIIVPFVVAFLCFTGLGSVSAATDSWSDTITHWSLGTGTTKTDYQYNINADKFPVSWDSSRSEIRYSGYTASYYTSRFLDPNISYSFATDFTYRNGSSSGSEIGTIYAWNWSGSNKYSYYLPGAPNRTSTGGRTTVYTGTGSSIHLTMKIRIECEKDLANMVCGSETYTKSI